MQCVVEGGGKENKEKLKDKCASRAHTSHTKRSRCDATAHHSGEKLAYYMRGVLWEIQCLQDRKECTVPHNRS